MPALLHGYNHHPGGGSNYHLVHGVVMIFAIPPVVSALLCVYIFVALFAQLHIADLQARMAPCKQSPSSGLPPTHPPTHPRPYLQARPRDSACAASRPCWPHNPPCADPQALKHEAFGLIGRFLVAKARARILGGVDRPMQSSAVKTLQHHQRDSSRNLTERIRDQTITQLPAELDTRELAAQGEQHAKWSEVFVEHHAESEKDKRMRSVYLEMLAANQFNALCSTPAAESNHSPGRLQPAARLAGYSLPHTRLTAVLTRARPAFDDVAQT